ncbi:MAG: SUMF1/EgtB/PvdO family nonheme iron enzyme, partial [Microvirga sp.]
MLQLEPRHRDHHPADGSHADMIRLPGGTFRMGSDRHYPDEAPVHRFTVDAFRIGRMPVTNRQFHDFVRATGHVTVAEIAPDPKDYPSALPRGPELRSLRAWDSHSTPGADGRLAAVRARLLSPLPSG